MLAQLKRFEEADEAYAKGLGCFDRALELEPESWDTWQSKGSYLFEIFRYDEALECYEKALAINAKNRFTWFEKGLVLELLGRDEEALECYDECLAIDPEWELIWRCKGDTLRELCRYEEALGCYDKALAINPDEAAAWKGKGDTLRELRCYEEALGCYDKTLAINPDEAAAWKGKGDTLRELCRYEKALGCYDKALAIDPDEAAAWKGKGYTLGQQGRYEEALQCFERTLQLKPQQADTWFWKGLSVAMLSRYQKALACCDRAAEIDPSQAAPLLLKGKILRRFGRDQEAIGCEALAVAREQPGPTEQRLLDDLGERLATTGARTSHRPEQYPQASESQEAAPSIITNEKDGAQMVWVPAGEFLMGSTDEEIARQLKADSSLKARTYDREKPQRSVYLDGYWIYKTEVTVAQYRKFCDATNREMPDAPPWGWKEDHPVVNVSWQDAADYAQWAGASLPTEAQWEKAARGTDGRENPWGGQWPPKEKVGNFCDESLARDTSELAKVCRQKVSEIGVTPLRGYDDGYVFTSPVGSYPAGASPYGCLDMAGNVCEWCADWYDEAYYAKAPSRNPQGPTSGSSRVLRGGSWIIDSFRCAYRYKCSPGNRYLFLGFRCARTL